MARNLRKILKQATSRATEARSISGGEKRGGHKPKIVTLPTLETARKITEAKK